MILITGASSGIGLACAEALAAQKKDLILVARRKDRLKDLADALTRKHNVKVHVFTLDIQNRNAIESFGQEQEGLLKRVTVLVNNAGLAKGMEPFQKGKIDDWEQMIDTNLKGLLYLTRTVLPHMIARKNGHVVNLGSVAGYWAYPLGNVYCATKFAVRGFTEALRIDLLGTGVRVTEIVPGRVETEFSLVRLGNAEAAKKVYEGMTPLSAADIAEAVVWSVDRPKHVNIQEIVIYPTDQASTNHYYKRTSKNRKT
ncbi:MAG: SDR family NAD(P)-dependent oxidoreductase [Bdellovibrionota bacterium]